MTHLTILSKNDIKVFDSPPVFNNKERDKFFELPNWASDLLSEFRTHSNKIGFILQFGYFKPTSKFFTVRKYHRNDIEFIMKKFDLKISGRISMKKYTDGTSIRHKQIILEKLGYQPFNWKAKGLLKAELFALSAKQMKPRFMFLSSVDFLRAKKIEIPSYHTFSEIITGALRNVEKELIVAINKNLSCEEKKQLEELLELGDEYREGEKLDAKIKRYKITLLKKSNQSTRPSKIKENIRDFKTVDSLFRKIEPIVNKLNLSPEHIEYYGQLVMKSRTFQINQREKRRYLLLIAFVVYHYYRLNDLLAEVLMQSVRTRVNSVEREHKEDFYNQRKEKQQVLNTLSKEMTDHLSIIKNAKSIVNNSALSAKDKVESLKALFSDDFENTSTSIENQLKHIAKDSKKIAKDEKYYDLLEASSVKLQNRASEIVKNIHFNQHSSNRRLIKAIEYYRGKEGKLGNTDTAPTGFLTQEEKGLIFNEEGKLRVPLYKVLLFSKIVEGIRSGALNLKYSYKYRAFDEYLIPQELWESQKKELLEKAGLLNLRDFSKIEAQLRETLEKQFKSTNENITLGINKHVVVGNKGELKITTPKQEKELPETRMDLFPKNEFISLFEILSTVNQASGFADSFEHWQIKNNLHKPPEKTFFAGVIGHGCNLGINKTARISRNINQYELENTINWYFTPENILRANDEILDFLNKLQLIKVFKRNSDSTHTSSDGQKFPIGVDSLNASYSFKYFGSGKGVSVYSFIDDSHRLFHSTVINPSEREAAYVIDGLMHNDVVQSDIHSTDTHGYSEMIFATSHLLGISFAPRIKNFKDQHLYSFNKPSILKANGYKVLPKKKINTAIIREQWDNILRLITTIKLKETTASQLFKRLSSYSRQHQLYRALKQFGRIIKTIFLLKYIDDVALRQMIEKQLNKLESSNKFGKAVFHGNNQEFQQSTKDEQLIADGCKRLIENAIICWNYMYLSQKIYDADSEKEIKDLICVIRNSSVVAWKHVNLQGEYDFSEEVLKNSISFMIPELLKLQIAA